MNSDLLEFTRQALGKGFARSEVQNILKQAGWAELDIKAATEAFASVDFPIPVPRPRPFLSAREVFLYLVLFSALYVGAYNLGSLIFEFINRAYPDPLQNRLFANSGDAIRWNIASVVVAFPLFLLMFRSVNRAAARDPIKRSSRPRRWLTYLTLFIAAVSLTGDLTYLVYNALGGELTIRFLLKVATVAVIAGGTFLYFLTDIRKEEQE
jgi:hypothetical protein